MVEEANHGNMCEVSTAKCVSQLANVRGGDEIETDKLC
jgi:hypothetical protein